MTWSVCESRLSRSHTACEPQQSSAISTGGCSGVALLTRRTKMVTPMMRMIKIDMSMMSIIFCDFFGWIHTESVYFLGREHLACRYLYSIFKFWIFKSGVHTESVYFYFIPICFRLRFSLIF